jgi:hypothetical protein
MAPPLRALVFLSLVATLTPARAACFPQVPFSQIQTGNYHYVLFPSSSPATADSLVGRFWQAGTPAANQGTCDETQWLVRCGADCTVQSTGPTFYVDGLLGGMPCTAACVDGEMVLLLEDRSRIFLAARVDETPGPMFDFSRLGVDLSPVAIPRPVVQAFSNGTATVRMDDPAAGFYGLPGIPATGTITGFQVLSWRGSTPPPERAGWTLLARVAYAGGTTTASVTVGDPCPPNDPRPLYVAAALELEGQVLTHYVSTPTSLSGCLPERWFGGGHVPEDGSEGLHLARSAAGELTLSWGASCVSPNSSAVYEGVLGDWTSHVPRTCGAPGTTATFLEPSWSAYYLVVPIQFNLIPPDVEGSYGLLSDGSERPAGAQRCLPYEGIVECP